MRTLSSSQLERYWQQGFLLVGGLFGPRQIAEFREESDRLWRLMEGDPTHRRIQRRRRVEGGTVADRIDPVADISPVFRAAAGDSRIIAIVEQLLKRRTPELFKLKLISKWPQTCGYALHQDYSYWPGLGDASPDDFVTVLVALDRFEAGSGALELFPGLHHAKLPPPPGNPLDVDENSVVAETGFRPELNPGDAVFFHSMTPHRSGPNRSDHDRQSLFFTYMTPDHDDLGRKYYSERPDDFMDPE